MAVSDERGNAIFSSNGNTVKEKADGSQEQLLNQMYMAQQHYGKLKEEQYALRESVLKCQYGTKFVWLDCIKDHGILKSDHPVFTILDCLNENIHNFGSCLCPEKIYKGRLPMTAEHDEKGKAAKKAPGNELAHICVPIVNEEDGWKQVDKKVLVEVGAQGYVPMLLDNAVLVCQRGGIIFIKEVPEVMSEETGELSYMEFNGKSFLLEVEKRVPYIYSTKKNYKDPNNPIPKWEEGFDEDMDLTFGIGHSIKSQEELDEIRNEIAYCNGEISEKTEDGERNEIYEEMKKNNKLYNSVDEMVEAYYGDDIKKFVDRVNNYCFIDVKDKDTCVRLKQNEFDAIVLLLFNMDFPLEGSDLGDVLEYHRGEDSPNFTEKEIIPGFTYTLVNDVRDEALVNRRNSEINLFLNSVYTYYDSSEKIKELGIDYIKY